MTTTSGAGPSKSNPLNLPTDMPPAQDAKLDPIPKPAVDADIDRIANRVVERVNNNPRAAATQQTSRMGRFLKGAATIGVGIGLALIGLFALNNQSAVNDQIQNPPAIEQPAPDLIPIQPGQGPPATPLNPAVPAAPPNEGIATPPGVSPSLPSAPTAPSGVVLPQIQIDPPQTIDSTKVFPPLRN